jgi:transposase-like protein
MKRRSDEFRSKVVAFSREVGIATAAKKFGVSKASISNWRRNDKEDAADKILNSISNESVRVLDPINKTLDLTRPVQVIADPQHLMRIKELEAVNRFLWRKCMDQVRAGE